MPLPRFTKLSLLITLAFSGTAQGGAVLYDYGVGAGDSRLPTCDDCFEQVGLSGKGIAGSSLQAAFYGHNYNSLYVNNNGSMSFRAGIWSYTPQVFPTPDLPPLIAPYFADVDTRNTSSTGSASAPNVGNVWYRTISDAKQLSPLTADFRKLYFGDNLFNPTFAQVITWDHVGLYENKSTHIDPVTKKQVLDTNTFQMALLSDGVTTYTIFKYPDQGLWADMGIASGVRYATYGFMDGYGNNYNGPGSGTNFMVTKSAVSPNIAQSSNSSPASAGNYVLRISSDDLNIMGNAYSWAGGSGSWAGTFGTSGGASFGGNAGTVTLSAAGFGRRLVVNSSGYTFTAASAANSLQLDNLQVAAADTAVTFAGNLVLLTHAGLGGLDATDTQGGALTRGKLTFTDNSILVARDAGMVNGADIILKKNAQLHIYTAESTTRKSTLTFDNSAGGGGALDLRGLSTTLGKVASAGRGAGAIKNSGAAPATLTIDFDNGSSTYDGAIQGAINLSKAGSGLQVLSGANTYTGATQVNAGELRINGNSSASAFTVAQGATLSGNGTIGTLNLAGTLALGNSPGQLNAGNTTFAGGSTYLWQINDATGTAGAGYDVLSVNGTLTLAGSGSNPITIRLQSLMADNSAGKVFNFDATHNYSYTLASASAGISGYLASEFLLDTSGFHNALLGGAWSVGVSGNDLQLNFVAAAVPEPSTYAMMFAGLAAIGAVARRRRKV